MVCFLLLLIVNTERRSRRIRPFKNLEIVVLRQKEGIRRTCGSGHFTILPNGEVYACRRVSDSKVGNVFEDSITDLWYRQMENYREFTRFKKCARCELLAWCRGCPAVAKGTAVPSMIRIRSAGR